MRELDKSYAPEGAYAVLAENGCVGCMYSAGRAANASYCKWVYMCMREHREDGRTVIFKAKKTRASNRRRSTERVRLNLDPVYVERLKESSAEAGVSLSHQVNEAIGLYLSCSCKAFLREHQPEAVCDYCKMLDKQKGE